MLKTLIWSVPPSIIREAVSISICQQDLNLQAGQCLQLCFKLLQGGEVRRYGNWWPVAHSQLVPRKHHVCESFLEERRASHLFNSKTEYVCLWHSLWCMKSDGQGLLTHLPADTPTHKHTRIDKHTLKLIIGLMKSRDKNSKIPPVPPAVFVRCVCVWVCKGFFCVAVQMPWHTLALLKPGNFLWGQRSVTAAGA